jgi:predicted nucleic acid-binding protein
VIRWFADSFFFLALLSDQDRAHSKAVRIIESLSVPIVTTAWVLVEVADAMSGPLTRARCVSLFASLEGHSRVFIVEASQRHYRKGLELYASRSDKDWSLTDCISFVIMQEQGINDALTGDRHFMQAGFRALFSEIHQ